MSGSLFWNSFRNKWFQPALPVTVVDLTGRTVIITGSNTGLGLEAAKHFYEMNPARLILAVRSIEKGEHAKNIILRNGKRRTNIEVWELDMGSFASVNAFTKKANDELERLDIFIANAGTATQQWATTKDGWESALQTNVLSTFLITISLVPLLKKTGKLPPPVPGVHLKPHLSIVASDTHKVAKFPERAAPNTLSALNNKANWVGSDRYSTSKLVVILLTQQLAHLPEFRNGDIIFSNIEPGFCSSELLREVPAFVGAIIFGIFAITPEQGSRNHLWASLADDIAPGSYVYRCRAERPLPFVDSPQGVELQKKLWYELKEVLIPLAPETAAVWETN